MEPRLILWDVDGTLVDSGGIGRAVYEEAFRAVTGRPLEHLVDMAGRTDRYIALSALAQQEDRLTALYDALAEAVRARRALLRERGSVLRGAREAIHALAAVPGVIQSVVTGNLQVIAVEKLSALDLTQHIDFEVGGYGSDGIDRRALVRYARQRAERKYDVALPWQAVVVIGDTPHDVAGARENGAVAIGVTTGKSSAHQLTAAGAQCVLPDLKVTQDVLEVILHA